MRILIGVASRHGATSEIAERLASQLADAGHHTTVLDVTHDPHDADATDGYDAFVIGSAIYEGRWIRGARSFVRRHAIELQRAPVWLFSSGPLGDDEDVGVAADTIDELVHAVDAIEHRLFTGKLDRQLLGRMERWIVDIVHAHEGDYRDWAAIDAWAAAIGAQLDRPAGDEDDR